MSEMSEKKICENFVNKVKPTVIESLTFEQKREVLDFISQILSRKFTYHLIDVRFTFWFIKRWYVAFLFGKDRRSIKRKAFGIKRTWLEIALNIMASFMIFLGVLTSIFAVLYVVKTLLGIDIFPNWHLINLF